jgi:hypothetical protein
MSDSRPLRPTSPHRLPTQRTMARVTLDDVLPDRNDSSRETPSDLFAAKAEYDTRGEAVVALLRGAIGEERPLMVAISGASAALTTATWWVHPMPANAPGKEQADAVARAHKLEPIVGPLR